MANNSESITSPNSGLGVTQPAAFADKNSGEQDLKLTDIKVAKSKELVDEIGRSGVLIMNGLIIGEEYNTDLQGREASKKYDEMRRSDATVNAALEAVKQPIMGANWDLEAYSESAQDMEIKDFVYDCLFNQISFSRYLRESFTHLDFGFAIFEKVFKPMIFNSKERVGLHKMAFRKQYSVYRWQMTNGQPGIQQWLQVGGFRDIPDWKIQRYTRNQEGDNYQGMSILRPVYKNWYMKDVLIKIDAMAHERHGVGIPKITVKSGTNADDAFKAREGARNFRSNEESYIEIPDTIDFEIVDSKSAQTRNPIDSVNYHTSQILMNVMAQFLVLGQSKGGSGSRSLSEDSSKLFLHTLESMADYFAEATMNGIIRDLVTLNWGEDVPIPTLKHDKIGDDNIELLSTAIQRLKQAGMLSANVETEQFVRKLVDLPVLTDEQVLEWTAPMAAPGGLNTDSGLKPAGEQDMNDETMANEILRDAVSLRDRIDKIIF